MPNHVHGIIVINESENPVEALHATSLRERKGEMSKISPKPGSLSAIDRSYKSAETRWARKNGHPAFAWQPRFYDHVIRDNNSLHEIRNYICHNPLKWDLEKYNPTKIEGIE